MDFFEHQERARRSTGRLVLLFVVSVVLMVGLVYALLVVALPLAGGEGVGVWNPLLLVGVVFGVGVLVGGGSLYKVSQLSGGGSVVAEHLGGRLLHGETRDPAERRVLNVVEEMAIASGIAVPPVYMMDGERGINAFAAGYSTRDAVIGVTRGTVETLSRDELQGVMAHEFSHILNGDMRLNIRLIGVLHGILLLGLIGQLLFRMSIYTPRSRSREGGSAVMMLLAVGAGLAAIGFVGTFMGQWIKASVSRQREFLADASAVQFTRNPGGIAGALKKIGGLVYGSSLRSPNAAEASHMYFSTGLREMFATHPPLPQRIKRIDPGWDGTFPEVRPVEATPAREAREAVRPTVIGRGRPVVAGLAGEAVSGSVSAGRVEMPSAEDAVARVGSLSVKGVERARRMVEGLPREVREAAHEVFGARAVVLCLLLDRGDRAVRERQMGVLSGDDGIAREVARLSGPMGEVAGEARLALVDLAIGTLAGMSRGQWMAFRKRMEGMIAADGRRDLFEWVLERIVRRHLDARFGLSRDRRVAYSGLDRLGGELGVVLSMLAHVGTGDARRAEAAYAEGAGRVGVEVGGLRGLDELGLSALGRALDELDRCAPRVKRVVLEACGAVVLSDRRVTVEEGELLRAVADELGCPMPLVV